jgi:hypothetical protein
MVTPEQCTILEYWYDIMHKTHAGLACAGFPHQYEYLSHASAAVSQYSRINPPSNRVGCTRVPVQCDQRIEQCKSRKSFPSNGLHDKILVSEQYLPVPKVCGAPRFLFNNKVYGSDFGQC